MDIRKIAVEYQPYIASAPISTGQAHQQACSNDQITIDRWHDIWVENVRKNKEKFGSFREHSLGKLFNTMKLRPCIIAGSGPSLKRTIGQLKDRPKGMGLVSCLHNFHFMEDHDADVDFYVSLDAGDITIKEVSEGGSKTPEEYWEITKDRKLICYIGTHPELLKNWQGEVYFYNAPVPHEGFRKAIAEIEPFHLWVESGGNVLGAATMIAKGFLGSQVSIFVGADFSFSNEEKRSFHAWDSSYDKDIGHCVRDVDIFGNAVLTWGSYRNFKLWFDVLAARVPGVYINASEAGTMGAYREGNIMQILQCKLEYAYEIFDMSRHKKAQAEDPTKDDQIVYI